MAELRPRVWVSQPLFDDIVERLGEWFDVDATREVTEAQALAEPNVQAFLSGLAVRKVIVVPGKIVNIVAG